MGHSVILIVANEPGAGREVEYNEWYTDKHVPMMFQFRGMKKASRYRLMGRNREGSERIGSTGCCFGFKSLHWIRDVTLSAPSPHSTENSLPVLAVLHTWELNLLFHPHLHCVCAGIYSSLTQACSAAWFRSNSPLRIPRQSQPRRKPFPLSPISPRCADQYGSTLA